MGDLREDPRLGQVLPDVPQFDFKLKLPSVSQLLGDDYTDELKEAFPDVTPPYAPFGYLALLQLRLPRKKSSGGIIIPDSEIDVERYRTQASLVRALGPVAFHDRQTGEPWKERQWYAPGSFIRCPMFGGDRFDVDYTPPGLKVKDKVTFVFIKEADAVALVTGDPLKITTS